MTAKEHIAALRAENPNLPAATIAEQVGISRQRVSQLLTDLGLPTKIPREHRRGPLTKMYRYGPRTVPCVIGSISELIVAMDLLSRGLDVHRSLTPNSVVDLIAMSRTSTEIARVEVRSGKLNRLGQPNASRPTHARYDIFAITLPDGEIVYSPPIESIFKNLP